MVRYVSKNPWHRKSKQERRRHSSTGSGGRSTRTAVYYYNPTTKKKTYVSGGGAPPAGYTETISRGEYSTRGVPSSYVQKFAAQKAEEARKSIEEKRAKAQAEQKIAALEQAKQEKGEELVRQYQQTRSPQSPTYTPQVDKSLSDSTFPAELLPGKSRLRPPSVMSARGPVPQPGFIDAEGFAQQQQLAEEKSPV